MSIESPADWRGLREVGHITRLTLDALEAHVRPGVSTAELDDVAAGVFAAHGARSAPAIVYGFPGTVLISINDEIVHGIPGPRQVRHGDLVKLDVTVEKNGYVADAARTVVVEGGARYRAPARGLRATRRSRRRWPSRAPACSSTRSAARSSREVRRQGFSVVRGLTGHGVGRTIHEEPSVPNDYDPAQTDVLTEGLVLTIEPMISAGSPHASSGPRRLDDPDARRQPGGARRTHARHHEAGTDHPDRRLRRVVESFGHGMLPAWPLEPGLTYLNHGTVGVTPLTRPRGAADDSRRDRTQPEPLPAPGAVGDHRGSAAPAIRPRLRQAADVVGAFVGVAGDDLVFVDNATTGVNAMLRSFPLEAG